MGIQLEMGQPQLEFHKNCDTNVEQKNALWIVVPPSLAKRLMQ